MRCYLAYLFMPPKLDKLPSIKGMDLSADTTTWCRFRLCLEEHRQRLRDIREEQGLEETDRVHNKMLEDYDDWEAWQSMFLQGCLRNPRASQTIITTRESFNKFLEPVPTAEQELIDELKEIKASARDFLHWLNLQSIDGEMPSNEVLNHDLNKTFEQLANYYGLACDSKEAEHLLKEIVDTLGAIAEYAKK